MDEKVTKNGKRCTVVWSKFLSANKKHYKSFKPTIGETQKAVNHGSKRCV